MTRHLVIPDTQIKPEHPIDHMYWAGRYACAMKPNVIVHLGDHWDFPSLSSYDVGKKSFEGRRYSADVEAGNEAMQVFMDCIRAEQQRLRRRKKDMETSPCFYYWQSRATHRTCSRERRQARGTDEL